MVDVSEDPLHLFRVRDAARFLAISERQTWRMIRSGELEAIKVGSAVRVTYDVLTAYVQRRRAQGAYVPAEPGAA